MGMKQVKLAVIGELSNHNSSRDEADHEAWAAFVSEVRRLASLPEHAGVIVDFDASED